MKWFTGIFKDSNVACRKRFFEHLVYRDVIFNHLVQFFRKAISGTVKNNLENVREFNKFIARNFLKTEKCKKFYLKEHTIL